MGKFKLLPPEATPASPAQIRKLMFMLYNHQHIWREEDAVHWVRNELGFNIETLGCLTHRQIGKCFEALGG